MQRSPAFVPVVLILYTVIAACVVAETFDLQWVHIIPDYMGSGLIATLSGFLVYTGTRFVTAIRTERGVSWRRRQVSMTYLLGDMTWGSMILCLVGVPVFFSAYTTLKSALPFMVDYSWDEPLAALEHFGRPSWQWLHAAIAPADWMADIYAIGWPAAMFLLFGIAACRGHFRVFTAFFLIWTIGGVLLAALFASKGPMLEAPVPELTFTTQKYLLQSMGLHYVQRGGGVSAMPSMHLATCVLINIYALRTWLFWPTALFTLMLWFLSVHLGFHYASDGIGAAGVALLCWKLAPCLNARLLFPVHRLFAWYRALPLPVQTRK